MILPPKRAVSATDKGSPVKKAKVTGVEEPNDGKCVVIVFTIKTC